MKQYIQALEHILEKGKQRDDRTGVGTRGVFGYQMRFDLRNSFPAVTTKRLAWKSVVSELLWFLEGSTDVYIGLEVVDATFSRKMRCFSPVFVLHLRISMRKTILKFTIINFSRKMFKMEKERILENKSKVRDISYVVIKAPQSPFRLLRLFFEFEVFFVSFFHDFRLPSFASYVSNTLHPLDLCPQIYSSF